MTRHADPIALTRDCPATTVPHGERVALSAGGLVRVVQRLGASTTVRTEMGTLLRIDGADATRWASTPRSGASLPARGPFHMDQVIDALHTIYDPEIPVSIVDLGLVYRCEEERTDRGGRRIEIDMTMTAPGCGMGDVLRADAARAVAAVPGVDDVEVALVWDPPWTLARVPEGVRLELGLL